MVQRWCSRGGAEVVQRCRVHKCRGAEVQRCKGAEVQSAECRCRVQSAECAEVQRCTCGADMVQKWCSGEVLVRCKDAEV
jgi:hypothetical protein